MVKTKGQLLSLGASGSIGKALTYSSWKGRPYAKQFKVPTDPKALPQLGIRDLMRYLSQEWAGLSQADKESWTAHGQQFTLPPYDAYMSANLSRYVDGKGITKAYPAAEQANAITVLWGTATVYERYLTIAISAIPANAGWATFIYRSQFSGFDPHPDNMIQAFTTGFIPQSVTIRDTPPTHANWYYRAGSTNPTGKLYLTAAQKAVTW